MCEPVTLSPVETDSLLSGKCREVPLNWGFLPGSPGGSLSWTQNERLMDQRKCMTHKVDLAVCNIARERGHSRLTQAT